MSYKSLNCYQVTIQYTLPDQALYDRIEAAAGASNLGMREALAVEANSSVGQVLEP